MRVSIPLPRRCERRTLPIELIPQYVSFSGLVGYDDRLTRGRSRVRFSAEVFWFGFYFTNRTVHFTIVIDCEKK